MPATRESLNIVVAGAGFAGLASAALLARDGHRVTVLEKFRQPQSVGAGILVQPSGLAALRILGIEDKVLKHGARIEHLYGVTPRGWPVVNIRYERWQAGAFGLGLHRAVLFEALWDLAQASGARIMTGHEATDLEALRQDHDLVVVADGCNSRLRAQSGLPCTDHAYPWGALWAVLDDPEGRYGSRLWQWYKGAGQMLGIMPTGQAPGRETPVVSFFWSLHSNRLGQWFERGLDAFKDEVLALNPACGDLLDQLASQDQLTWARYHDITMRHYHGDKCVVIGDAAHATSPQLGQGTNLALLDAVALRNALRAQLPLAEALARYTRLRKRHTHFYGQASRWLTPLFQSDQVLLPLLRDLFMAAGTALPFTGRLTCQTLVGVQQGWWPGNALVLDQDRDVPQTSPAPV